MTWQDHLDQKQKNEVAWARLYQNQFGHGTPGHGRLLLIAKMADLLSEVFQGNPPDPSRRALAVPYHSQWEADAKKAKADCGPACVEMIGKFATGRNDGPGTNEIMRHITRGRDRPTAIRELIAAAQALYDVTLERFDEYTWNDLLENIFAGQPAIVLVKYGHMAMRLDRNYTTGHYLVAVGWDQIDYQGRTVERLLVHDPDWWGKYQTQGAFLPLTQEHFMGMWDGAKEDYGNPARSALVLVR